MVKITDLELLIIVALIVLLFLVLNYPNEVRETILSIIKEGNIRRVLPPRIPPSSLPEMQSVMAETEVL